MHLFLFPHQDDEVPVYHQIEILINNQQPFAIVYLTTGQASSEICTRRNQESLSVLSNLGVPRKMIHFLGEEIGVPDGQLQIHLEPLFQRIKNLMSGEMPIQSIYMPAWEGGHQDHDASHLLGLALASHWRCIKQSYQFPYYHGEGLRGILFKALSPLSSNGSVQAKKIPPFKRFKYMLLLLHYRSQARTWLGLGPFVLMHYILNGCQIMQRISIQRIKTRPHEGPLLYERRAFCSYERFFRETDAFLRRLLH